MNECLLEMIWVIVLILLGAFIAPILDGLRRKIRAKIQRRIGPPLLQTFYDLSKLFNLQPVLPFKNMFIIVSPYIVFATLLVLSAAVPLPYVPGFSTVFDTITLLYTLLFVSVLVVLLGLALPNPYSNAGSTREALTITVFEVFIAFTIVGIAYSMKTLNLYGLAVLYGFPKNYLRISTLFLSASLFILAYIESAYTPFDMGEAETEVLGGPYLEFSGRYYGLFLYALLLKRYILLSLPVSLVLVSPIAMMLRAFIPEPLLSVVVLGVFVLFLFITMSVYSVVEALYPRYRVDLAFKPLILASVIPFIGLVMGWLGW